MILHGTVATTLIPSGNFAAALLFINNTSGSHPVLRSAATIDREMELLQKPS
jgi:hypothetical protein